MDPIITIAVGLVTNVLLGFGAAFFTAKELMARHDERLTTLEDEVRELGATAKLSQRDERETFERLIRVETKIDMLLSGRISTHGEDSEGA